MDGRVHVSGYAEPAHEVFVTIDGTEHATHRDGAYYYASVEVNNSSGPVAADVTVTVRSAGETVRTEEFTRLVPAATDSWSHDARGNKLADSNRGTPYIFLSSHDRSLTRVNR